MYIRKSSPPKLKYSVNTPNAFTTFSKVFMMTFYNVHIYDKNFDVTPLQSGLPSSRGLHLDERHSRLP